MYMTKSLCGCPNIMSENKTDQEKKNSKLMLY